MPIPIRATTPVSSTDATGDQTIADADAFNVHRFFIRFTSAATVQIQGSADGTNWIDLLTTDVTTTGNISEVDRPWRNLRVEWTGNDGTLTVDLEQMYALTGRVG